MGINQHLLTDFCVVSKEIVRIHDEDSWYPVLVSVYNQMNLSEEQRLWFTWLVLLYYNLTSAAQVFERHPYPEPLDEGDKPFKCGTERRGMTFLKDRLLRSTQDYLDKTHGGRQREWVYSYLQGHDRNSGYENFWEASNSVWGVGRMIAFKWAEMLRKLHGIPLYASDMKLRYCSGPKNGLELLTGYKGKDVAVFDYYGRILMAECQQRQVPVDDWEQLETLLCAFLGVYHGRYYCSADIDKMQTQILRMPQRLQAVWWQARKDVIPNEQLGELHGWVGENKAYKEAYSRGVIIGRAGFQVRRSGWMTRKAI